MAFFDYIWKEYIDTERSKLACIVFYQGGSIDHFTYVTVTVDQSSAKYEYNVSCTTLMSLAYFRMQ